MAVTAGQKVFFKEILIRLIITSKKLGLHLERTWLVVIESEIYRNDWNFLDREIASGRDVDGRPIIAVFEVNSFVIDK